jgi:menaquinone-9 beta-reductase
VRQSADVIIVGAGIAGSSSAIALAREGFHVLLLDRETFPRHKPCGEGVMPQGVVVLGRLGVLDEIMARGGQRVRGLRFRSRDGARAECDFPPRPDGSASFGVVMRRRELDDILLRKAASSPNVTLLQGFRAVEAIEEDGAIRGVAGRGERNPEARVELRAPLTLGADGIHSIFHGRHGIRRTFLPRRRFGISGHLEGVPPLGEHVEVIHHDGFEVYAAPANEGLTLVAVLLEERLIKGAGSRLPERYLELLHAVPGFGDRIAGGTLVPPIQSRGPFAYTVAPVYRPGLLLLGDSAGFLDPITGEGMTWALKCTEAAVPIIGAAFAGGDFGEAALRPYAAAREAVIEDIWKLTEIMLALSRFEGIANRAIRRLGRDPALFQKLMGIATGTARYRDVTLKDRLLLGLG